METQQLMTPPHSHAQLLYALFRAIDNRSWLVLAQYFDPAVRYERPGYATICGLDDLVLFYQDVRIIGDGEHIIEGIVTDEELGACWGEFRGFTRDRRPIKERYCDAYTFANGRILTRRSHFFRPAV